MNRPNALLASILLSALLAPSFHARQGAGQSPPYRPEPRKGSGVTVLRAARLIDGTGRAPIAAARRPSPAGFARPS